MNTQLSYFTSVITFTAALILPACATAPQFTAQDILLKDIPTSEVSLYANATSRVVEDDVCQTFYSNTGDFITQPKKTSVEEVLGIFFLSAVAGAATYGVGNLGIANPFTALSLAASTNQVVYEGGRAVMEDRESVKTDLHPDVEIADAALRLGCPEPSKAAMKLAVIQAKEDKNDRKKLTKLRGKKRVTAVSSPVPTVQYAEGTPDFN